MFKKLVSPLMVLALILTFSTPKKSEAIVGGLTQTLGIVVLGYATVGGSILTGVNIGVQQTREERFLLGVVLGAIVAAAGSYVGLILLEEDQTIQFSTMDANFAKKLGVTESERLSFNSELEEANFAFEDIKQNAEGLSPAEITAMWKEYSASLSEKTFSTIQKISKAL